MCRHRIALAIDGQAHRLGSGVRLSPNCARVRLQLDLLDRMILSGVAGISDTTNPACLSALMTAGAGPSIGISPTPLAPNGPCLYGFSRIFTVIGGVSSVVGMM